MHNCRRGWGQSANEYICIVPYMKHIWCNGFPEIYAQLEEGGWVNLPWVYVHCAIYMKLIWCNGFPEIYGQLEDRGWGQSDMGICALCYIFMKLIWCNGFPNIYGGLEEGVGQSAMGICALCYIWNLCNGFPEISASRSAKFGVVVFKASMLNWWRVDLPVDLPGLV